MAVIDVYDAIRTPRPYHAPVSHDAAVASIVSAGGTHFDPDVVTAFVVVSENLRRISAECEQTNTPPLQSTLPPS
jgi:putative two-component system response regulator